MSVLLRVGFSDCAFVSSLQHCHRGATSVVEEWKPAILNIENSSEHAGRPGPAFVIQHCSEVRGGGVCYTLKQQRDNDLHSSGIVALFASQFSVVSLDSLIYRVTVRVYDLRDCSW